MLKKILLAFVIITIGAVGIIFLTTQKDALTTENESNDIIPKIVNGNKKTETKTEPQTDNNQTATTTTSADDKNAIKTFEQCVAAGKKVIGDKPNRRCIVNDDLAYIEIESCAAPTGESMNIYDAQKAFETSQCSREGSPDKHYCNENTGTWWIDIVAYRKGCSPACVINVATKKAEINWRCTGANQ